MSTWKERRAQRARRRRQRAAERAARRDGDDLRRIADTAPVISQDGQRVMLRWAGVL